MVKGFKEGDVVQLKSGGPQMTAVDAGAGELDEVLAAMNAGQLHCRWFSTNGKLQKDWFRPDTLARVVTK